MANLSPSEFETICQVLKRDSELRSIEEARIRDLKAELSFLRRRAALRPGLERCCARCLAELGRILNRGALCPLCLRKVCKDCRFYPEEENPDRWLCVYCFKQMQLKAISGEWMHEFCVRAATKEEAGEQIQRLLQYPLPTGLFDNGVSAELSQEKPNQIFPCESQTAYSDIKPTEAAAGTQEDKMEDSKSSPEVLPRVSPWSGIDPEPTIPTRINKSRPLGTVQHESTDLEASPVLKEQHLSDESRFSKSGRYRSCSASSDAVDESESQMTVPLRRKRSSPFRKQHAAAVHNRRSSVDTTDSGESTKSCSSPTEKKPSNRLSLPPRVTNESCSRGSSRGRRSSVGSLPLSCQNVPFQREMSGSETRQDRQKPSTTLPGEV